MVDTEHTHNTENSKPQRDQHPTGGTTQRLVGQDKTALSRGRAASIQPAPQKEETRARRLNTETTRRQKWHSSKRQTVQVILWVKPRVKAALQRIAEQEGLSMSATGGAFLEKAIQSDLHSQHGALLEAVIESAIQKGMRAYSNRSGTGCL